MVKDVTGHWLGLGGLFRRSEPDPAYLILSNSVFCL